MKGGNIIQVWEWQRVKSEIDNATGVKRFLLAAYFGTGARLRELLEVKKSDIQDNDIEGTKVLQILLPTFKNKKVNARTVYLDYNKEAWLIAPIKEWLETISEPNQPLLSKSGRWVELKFQEWFGKKVHFFRHSRATYNTTFWHMRDVENQIWMGWSDTQMASRYTHLTTRNMVDIFKRKQGEN